MPSTAHPLAATAAGEQDATLFAALELSLSRWIVVASAPGESKVSRHTLPACDGPALLALLEELRRRAERRCRCSVAVVTIQEAGRDGFWLRNQPQSALSLWYRERVGDKRGRVKRIAIMALARKLLVTP